MTIQAQRKGFAQMLLAQNRVFSSIHSRLGGRDEGVERRMILRGWSDWNASIKMGPVDGDRVPKIPGYRGSYSGS